MGKRKVNFGWRSRDPSKALRYALRAQVDARLMSYGTAAAVHQRAMKAFEWMRSECGVRRWDHVRREHVEAYAQHIAERAASGQLAARTAQNAVSAVNTAMRVLTRGAWQSVSPRAMGVPRRSEVRTTPTPTPLEARAAIEAARARDPVAGAILQLQHALGLRIREAALLNARAAVRQAVRTGNITIGQGRKGQVGSGTKGGRARTIPVDAYGLQALRDAAAVQPQGSRSMIPSDQSLRDAIHRGSIRVAREAARSVGIRPHDLRAAYAARRYEALTGRSAPCNGGGKGVGAGGGKSALSGALSDREAREVIAAELGHGRAYVLAAYIGSAGGGE